jgi:hypothetical protein
MPPETLHPQTKPQAGEDGPGDGFRFTTKGRALERLAPLLTLATCCDQVIVSVARWTAEREAVAQEVIERWPAARLAVRSSSDREDAWHQSQAGVFHSVIGVDPSLPPLMEAVDEVIASYGDKAGGQEILIQPMVEEVEISGVILTRDLDTGAPYYVINYDDFSGRTDTVTGGGISKMTMVHRSNSDALRSPRMRKLVEVAKEIETLTRSETLDIEFCVGKDFTVYVLQVRPLAASKAWTVVSDDVIADALTSIRRRLVGILKPDPGLAGQTTILGEMPDWNPAEMIGTTPRPLALSIYKNLITDHTWSEARTVMGYRAVERPLMLDFIGRPYIDVRCSLNSFLPASLDEGLAHRLVDHQLARLNERKDLHDKIEFEIAITSLDLNFPEQAGRLEAAGFSKDDIETLEESLRKITANAIGIGSGGLREILTQTDHILNRAPDDLPSAPLDRARTLLAEIIPSGTLPFSILARHAFIGVSFLRSMVAREVIGEEDANRFMLGIETIATDLIKDMGGLATGAMTRPEFLSVYGHLRPGTYDITSWRYDEMPDLYIGEMGRVKTLKKGEGEAFALSSDQEKALQSLLRDAGYEIGPVQLLDYISTSIAAREQSKFAFTRGISDTLAALGEWGAENGFTREGLSYLDIHFLFDNEDDPGALRNYVDEAKETHRLARAIRLHHLIAEERDIDVVFPARGQPTFITNKSVTAPFRHLHTNEAAELDGCIVLIESADPGFDWIFSHDIAGLVTQFGGANSHMAIRCAEFGLPAAIGCAERTFDALLKSSVIELNCQTRKLSGH